MDKKLYRIPEQGTITGVCAGLAEYFNIDVTIIRVLAVISAFATGGFAILLYFIVALIIPVKGGSEADRSVGERVESLAKEVGDRGSSNQLRNWIGASLAVVGLWLLLATIWPELFRVKWEVIWPILLIVAGVVIITKGRK